MARFERFEPDPAERAAPYAELEVRPMADADVPRVGAMIAAREELDPIQVSVRLRSEVLECGERRALFVAVREGVVVGFGRVAYWDKLRLLSERPAPEGYYLLGVITCPEARRRGVARALTRARLEWLHGRAREVFYFANAHNMASVALHARFGFAPVTRLFDIPGVTFDGGEGVLFRAPVPSPGD